MGESCTKDDCVKKWKNLRDTFVRELRKVKKKKRKTGEKGPPYTLNWPYYNIMQFLVATVKHRG